MAESLEEVVGPLRRFRSKKIQTILEKLAYCYIINAIFDLAIQVFIRQNIIYESSLMQPVCCDSKGLVSVYAGPEA